MTIPIGGTAAPARDRGASKTAAPAAGEALQKVAWLDADAALASLDAFRVGLDEPEVERRRAQYGLNEVAREKTAPWFVQLGQAIATPFNVLLATLAIVSAGTGDDKAVVVIGSMVLLS